MSPHDDRPWVLLDCDDVKLDFIGRSSRDHETPSGFAGYLREVHGIETQGRPGGWGMTDWLGHDPAAARAMIEDFIERHDGFGRLEPVEGAVEAISALRAIGYRIASITSCSRNPEPRVRRLGNLQAIFGDAIERLHMVGLGESKIEVLSAYPPSIWVDDNPGNAEAGARLGHRSLLFPAAHNVPAWESPAPGVEPIRGWADVVRIARAEMEARAEISCGPDQP